MPRQRITLKREQIEDAIENGGETFEQQAEYLGVSKDVYRRERELYQQQLMFNERMIQYLTERDPKLELMKEQNMDSFVFQCSEIYERSKKTIGYNEVTVDLGDDDVGVKIDCDWHIGNEMTNIKQWSEDIALTKKMKRCYTVLDGDYTDNLDAIKKAGAYESILSVPEAKQKVRNAVAMLRDKVIGVIQGCHDEWFFNQDSWDIAQYLADHCGGYWLGFRGIINIKLGEQTYRIYARHKYRRHSTDNETWGMLYKFRKLEKPVDIMMSGHHHHPTVRSLTERGQRVHLCMGGAYKPYDRFIEHRDIDAGVALMPGFLLRADKHQITPFLDFKELDDYF